MMQLQADCTAAYSCDHRLCTTQETDADIDDDLQKSKVKSKCLPILLYGLEACPLTKSNLQSLDLVINRLFMKLFKTSNIDTVKCCQEYFNFDLSSVLCTKRMLQFEVKFSLYLSS